MSTQVYTDVRAARVDYDPAGPTSISRYVIFHVGDKDLIDKLGKLVGEDALLEENGCTYLVFTENQVSDAASRAVKNADEIRLNADSDVQEAREVEQAPAKEVEALKTKAAKLDVELREANARLAKAEAASDASEPETVVVTKEVVKKVVDNTSPRQIKPGRKESASHWWDVGTVVRVVDQSVPERDQEGRIVKRIVLNDRPAYRVALENAGELPVMQSSLRRID